jgi:hypothetical protein
MAEDGVHRRVVAEIARKHALWGGLFGRPGPRSPIRPRGWSTSHRGRAQSLRDLRKKGFELQLLADGKRP